MSQDKLQSFLFKQSNIRGAVVRLDESLQNNLATHEYPTEIQALLSQAILVLLLLSHTLKSSGEITLQIQAEPEHALKLILAQCDENHRFRGLAEWHPDMELSDKLTVLVGHSSIVFTHHNTITQRQFQSIVAVNHDSFIECLEDYFQQSEQIPTKFYLFQQQQQAVGILLQAMPDSSIENDDWQRLNMFADTVTTDEIFSLSNDELLHRLYHQEDIIIYDAETVTYQCKCSIAKMRYAVKLLGHEDAEALLQERGSIEVSCEFCNKNYRFDNTDIAIIFADSVISDAPKTKQ